MVVYCGIADLSLNDKFPGVCKLVTKEEVIQRVSEQGGEALQRGLSLDFTKGVLEFGHDPVVGEEKCPYVQVGSVTEDRGRFIGEVEYSAPYAAEEFGRGGPHDALQRGWEMVRDEFPKAASNAIGKAVERAFG